MRHNIPTIVISISLVWLSVSASSQTPQWWADNVGWDGISPYQTYIKLSSSGMGPNALPVPTLHNPLRSTSSWFSTSAQIFHHTREWTYSSYLELNWRISNWLRLEIEVMPLEYYHTQHELKEERKIFWEAYDDQFAGGDIYIETAVRIPPLWLAGLHSELRIGLKTASGTHLGAARFTDTPGYYADLTTIWNPVKYHMLEIMLGFLAYQTYESRSRQNDCLLWGMGHAFTTKKWRLYHSLRGYKGYLHIGDSPMLYEVEVTRFIQKNWEINMKAGLGIADYPYRYAGIGTKWLFNLEIESEYFLD